VKRELVKKIEQALSQEKWVSDLGFSIEERAMIRDLHLLTAQPMLFATNVSEKEIGKMDLNLLKEKLGLQKEAKIIPVSAKVEAELNDLPPDEAKAFLEDLGLKESSLNALIREAYDVLGLQTYFTAGPKEVRAWTIRKGWTAPQAAGVIHSDFEKGFIRAEVVFWKDYLELGGESACRTVGKLKAEGKDYIVRDGDVMHFLFRE
jgi:GTP-binding protein YchF